MAIDANVQTTATGRGQPAMSAVARDSLALEPQLQRVERVSAGLWRDAGRRLARDRAALAGLVVIALLIVVAVVAPAVAPYPPNDQSFRIKLEPPSTEHLLGTDE
ncbi:MAG: peptide transporter permease, partial [Thermomicrobiales bacterium]|nr:peptide transporter permease [Thermomicrobiales bacterium]